MSRFPALLIPAALLLLTCAAHAQVPAQAFEKTVTFNFVNSNLLTAIVQMERQCYVQCILRDGIDAQRPVNLNMRTLPLSQALRFLASVADARVTQNADGVYVFTPGAPAMPYGSRFSLPPTHFSNGFRGSGSWGNGFWGSGFGDSGFGSSAQQPLIVFLYTVPVRASALGTRPSKINRAGTDLPGEPHRVYALD